MSDSELSRLDRLSSAREEFKASLPRSNRDRGEEETAPNEISVAANKKKKKAEKPAKVYPKRFNNIKVKNSSSDDTVTSSITIYDAVTEAKYVVSVGAVVSGEEADPSILLDIQAAITEFLQNIHGGL